MPVVAKGGKSRRATTTTTTTTTTTLHGNKSGGGSSSFSSLNASSSVANRNRSGRWVRRLTVLGLAVWWCWSILSHPPTLFKPPLPTPPPTTHPPIIWSWHYASSSSTASTTEQEPQQQKHDHKTTTDNGGGQPQQQQRRHGRNMLLAQATGIDEGYAQMLDATSVVNRAYARKFGYDYVSMMGMVLGGREPWHSTFGKVEVLHQALQTRQYDGVLILDSDAVLVDFEVDIGDLVQDEYALVAQYVHPGEHQWEVNIGVSLWNLHHPRTAWLSQQWRSRSIETLQSDTPADDQWLLQLLLRDDLTEAVRNTTIHTVNQIFDYRYGTVVKHFIRITGLWNETLQDRIQELQHISNQTCAQFTPHCHNIGPLRLFPHQRTTTTT